MLKKTGLSLLVSLGVLSAAELASPAKDTDVVVATTEAVNKEEGSPRLSEGKTPKARLSKRDRVSAETKVEDTATAGSESDGSASEKDAKKGPKSETVVLGTQLAETQLIPSDSTLSDETKLSSDALVTEAPANAEDTKEVVAMTQAPSAVVAAEEKQKSTEASESDSEESEEAEEVEADKNEEVKE